MRVKPPPFWTPVLHRSLQDFQLMNGGHPTAFLLAAFLCIYCRETRKNRFPKRALAQLGTGLRRSQLRSALKSLMDQGLVSEEGDDIVVRPLAVFGEQPPEYASDDDGDAVDVDTTESYRAQSLSRERPASERVATATAPQPDQVRTTSEPLPNTDRTTSEHGANATQPQPGPVAATTPPLASNDSEDLDPPYKRVEDNRNRREEKRREEKKGEPPPSDPSKPVYVTIPIEAQQPGARAQFPKDWKPNTGHRDYAMSEWGMPSDQVVRVFKKYCQSGKTYEPKQFTTPDEFFARCIDWAAEDAGLQRQLLARGRQGQPLTGAAQQRNAAAIQDLANSALARGVQ